MSEFNLKINEADHNLAIVHLKEPYEVGFFAGEAVAPLLSAVLRVKGVANVKWKFSNRYQFQLEKGELHSWDNIELKIAETFDRSKDLIVLGIAVAWSLLWIGVVYLSAY